MEAENREIIATAKQHLKTHKVELILIGLGAIAGAGIGYYWWLIDFI